MIRRLTIAAAVLGFLVISLGIARVLGASSDEHGAIERLVAAEGRGDLGAVTRLVGRCGAGGCRALVARVHHPGAVQVLRMDPDTVFRVGGYEGTTRVAWKVGRRFFAQCVRVRRRGNLVAGFDSALVAVSAPISVEKGCG